MILAHITQPSRMPLCPPVPCLPSVWVPVLSSAVPGHARVLAGETTLVVFAYRSDKHAAVLLCSDFCQ